MFKFLTSQQGTVAKRNEESKVNKPELNKAMQTYMANYVTSQSDYGGMLSESSVAQLRAEGIYIPAKVATPKRFSSAGEKKSNGANTKMPSNAQTIMESSFGTNFSAVNIHSNDQSATQIGAQAYTEGCNVHFAPGKYNPQTMEGQELLGHELTHVVQQKSGNVQPSQMASGKAINNDRSLENEAYKNGKMAAKGKGTSVFGKGGGVQMKGNGGILPGDPPQYSANIGLSFGTGGLKVFFTVTVDKKMGDFTGSYGFGATYHSQFYDTGKSGLELRNSFMLDYQQPNDKFGISLGTNMWNGLGAMADFTQRTGMMNIRGDFYGFTYENDGTPFNLIGLRDAGDSYRTAAASLQLGDLSLNTSLFTGLRDQSSFRKEKAAPGGLEGYPQ